MIKGLHYNNLAEGDKSEFGVLVMKKKKITVFVVMIIIVVIVI